MIMGGYKHSGLVCTTCFATHLYLMVSLLGDAGDQALPRKLALRLFSHLCSFSVYLHVMKRFT